MDNTRLYLPALVLTIFVLFNITACKEDSIPGPEGPDLITPGPGVQQQTQQAFNDADEGDVIEFGAGMFEFDRTLNMDGKSNITIKGQGRDQTILSFADQSAGSEGMHITNSNSIVVKELTIQDTRGDALKFNNSNGIVMYRVGTEWSGEPSTGNGAYGLYPVFSSNILIEESYAYGASDAGIYVGQSDKAIVRNSTAEGNVAGIEIENTTNADVHNNTVTDNAAGILVFDLPGLSRSGSQTRVFNNDIIDNLRGNFASPGSIVAETPAGTGILVLSTDQVRIFNNTLEGNNVMGTAVASYAALAELGFVGPIQDPNYNPYPRNIYIHDNSYSRSNTYPPASEQSDFGNLLVQSFGTNPVPDIIVDGIIAPGSEPSGSICIQDNSGSSFVNLNLPNNFPQNLSFDPSAHNCSLQPLPAVELTIPEYQDN